MMLYVKVVFMSFAGKKRSAVIYANREDTGQNPCLFAVQLSVEFSKSIDFQYKQ